MNDASNDPDGGIASLGDPRRNAIPQPRDIPPATGAAVPTRGVEPDTADPVNALHALASDGLTASAWADEEARRRATASALASLVRDGAGEVLARAIDDAPSLAVARYLWRALEAVDTDPRIGTEDAAATIATTLFAIPVIVVAGVDARAGTPAEALAGSPGSAPDESSRVVSGILRSGERLAAILREHRALGDCETFVLAGTLATAEAIGPARLPALLGAARPDIPGSLLDPGDGGERVFLRFAAGALIAAPAVDPFDAPDTDGWGTPFAHALQADLATPGVTLLALPLPPRRLASALRRGRAAQREVAALLFASNAIRKFRSRVGEPTAIISAHRASDATGGGELRLSLSSPFDPRETEGLRVALHPYEAVADVATMLVDLLREFGIGEIRIEAGVHPDYDSSTGLRLLFKDSGSSLKRGPAH